MKTFFSELKTLDIGHWGSCDYDVELFVRNCVEDLVRKDLEEVKAASMVSVEFYLHN